jgi:hypothetical protein
MGTPVQKVSCEGASDEQFRYRCLGAQPDLFHQKKNTSGQ